MKRFLLSLLYVSAVVALRDDEAWALRVAEEDEQRDLLQRASDHWGEVAQHLEDL